MRVLGNLVLKELRELLTPQTLLPMVAIMVLFVFVGRLLRGERTRATGPEAVLVVDADQSALTQRIKWTFQSRELLLIPSRPDVDGALAEARADGIAWVIAFPAGLEQRVERHEPAEIEVYGLVSGFSVAQSMKGLKVNELVRAVNDDLVRDRLEGTFPDADPGQLSEPLAAREFVVVRDRVVPGNPALLSGLVMSRMMMIPVVLMLVIILASQMIASSIGQEKENKTLETLLTVPVSRLNIVLGKMLGASVFALVATGIFMAAFSYYMGSVIGDGLETGAGALGALGLGMTIQAYVLVGAALFLAVLAALSVVTILAALADDARSAQVATLPVTMLVMLPYFLTTFFDIRAAALPLKLLVYAIPFSYPFLVPRAVMFGEYGEVCFGFAYMALFAVAMVWLATRLMSGDRVLTARLRLRRRQR